MLAVLQQTRGKQLHDLLPLLNVGFEKQILSSARISLVTRISLLHCFPLGHPKAEQKTTGVTLGPTGYTILKRKYG